ncbi:MAG: cyanophycinase [Verrucomicrobia bacterium]|nr:cyanophycinase [Verrucomicrobiota bacterium]
MPRVSNLTTTNATEALAAVRAAEVIWFPGGEQSRQMAELNRLGLVAAIRERHATGAVIGGTSAGAAVMAKVMITGSPKNAGEVPPLAEGLGLWPEAIVDQHFVVRKREPRLQAAVKANPKLLGVGIDESTYVVVNGNGFEVSGKSVVIVFDGQIGSGIKRTEMKSGQRYSISGEAK